MGQLVLIQRPRRCASWSRSLYLRLFEQTLHYARFSSSNITLCTIFQFARNKKKVSWPLPSLACDSGSAEFTRFWLAGQQGLWMGALEDLQAEASSVHRADRDVVDIGKALEEGGHLLERSCAKDCQSPVSSHSRPIVLLKFVKYASSLGCHFSPPCLVRFSSGNQSHELRVGPVELTALLERLVADLGSALEEQSYAVLGPMVGVLAAEVTVDSEDPVIHFTGAERARFP